jgi:hypothetical protein
MALPCRKRRRIENETEPDGKLGDDDTEVPCKRTHTAKETKQQPEAKVGPQVVEDRFGNLSYADDAVFRCMLLFPAVYLDTLFRRRDEWRPQYAQLWQGAMGIRETRIQQMLIAIPVPKGVAGIVMDYARQPCIAYVRNPEVAQLYGLPGVLQIYRALEREVNRQDKMDDAVWTAAAYLEVYRACADMIATADGIAKQLHNDILPVYVPPVHGPGIPPVSGVDKVMERARSCLQSSLDFFVRHERIARIDLSYI